MATVLDTKGKTATRSWGNLPPDVIRLIGQYTLECNWCWIPLGWRHSHSRSYNYLTVLNHAKALDQLFSVNRNWRRAINTHHYWKVACAWFDSTFTYYYRTLATAGPLGALTFPFTRMHYILTIESTCLPCAISGRVWRKLSCEVDTAHFGAIRTCKNHSFDYVCGVCLIDYDTSVMEEYSPGPLADTDDPDTWPGVHTTCGMCRRSALYDQLRFHKLDSALQDSECKSIADTYIELGESTIKDVLEQLLEKQWLIRNTKLSDMISQAVASSRYMRAEVSPDCEVSSSDESEDGEVEALSWSEEYTVREFAMSDFNRTRIMNGLWFSPIDHYNLHHRSTTSPRHLQLPIARHPVNSTTSLPPPSVILDIPPTPTYVQATNLHRSWRLQMENILLPAMKNLARGIVCSSNIDGSDPCKRAAKMTIENVLEELQQPYPWIIQFDYQSKRYAEVQRDRIMWEERRRTEHSPSVVHKRESTASMSSHSSEDSTLATSPTESHSTLQTTPSPPPISSPLKLTSGLDDTPPASRPQPQRRLTPPPPPQLLTSVPYVPRTSDFPPETLECVKDLWRTARAPIFECLCAICRRRFTAEQAALGRERVVEKTADEQLALNLSQQEVEERKLALLKNPQGLDGVNQVLAQIPSIVLPSVNTTPNNIQRPCSGLDQNTPLSLTPSLDSGKNPKKRSSAELDDVEDKVGPAIAGGNGGSPKRVKRKESIGDTYSTPLKGSIVTGIGLGGTLHGGLRPGEQGANGDDEIDTDDEEILEEYDPVSEQWARTQESSDLDETPVKGSRCVSSDDAMQTDIR